MAAEKEGIYSLTRDTTSPELDAVVQMHSTLATKILKSVRDFSQHSSLHGLQYLGESNRSCVER